MDSDHSTGNETQQEPLPSSVADSPLFKLPPELRNMVYRYTIITDDDQILITKTTGIPEPALLSACKTTRSEARAMFYLENKFMCEVDEYSPASPMLYIKSRQRVAPRPVSLRLVTST